MFPGFVTKQKNTTATVASIEDVLDCTARADALVSGVLHPVMAQRRAAGTALAAASLADDPDDLIGPGVAFDETADLKRAGPGARRVLPPVHDGVLPPVRDD